MMKRKSVKRLGIAAGILLAVVILAPFIIPLVIPWSQINCRHQDINITTGQARFSRYFWFVKVSERVEDTSLSKILDGEEVRISDIKPWHRVNTFSPWQTSPHHFFHSAFFEIGLLSWILRMNEAPLEIRKEAAREVLKAWQHSGSDSEANKYLNELRDTLEKKALPQP